MKLVHDSSSRDGELPAAESCGIDDEEISPNLTKSPIFSLQTGIQVHEISSQQFVSRR